MRSNVDHRDPVQQAPSISAIVSDTSTWAARKAIGTPFEISWASRRPSTTGPSVKDPLLGGVVASAGQVQLAATVCMLSAQSVQPEPRPVVLDLYACFRSSRIYATGNPEASEFPVA